MKSTLRIGTVLFPGFELLDVYGPLEMFGMMGEKISLVMLAETPGPVPSNQGPRGLADLSLARAGDLDLFLVPGGLGTRKEVANRPFLDLIGKIAEKTPRVATVCTGSALLARTGLLDERKATSNKMAWDWVIKQGPAVHWVREARWVEDGKFFTSSGVSAGMDMGLALIEKLFDRVAALESARKAEYLWNESACFDPFTKLDS